MQRFSVLCAALCLASSPAVAADDICVQQANVDFPILGLMEVSPAWWDASYSACEHELSWGGATPIPNGRMVWDQSTQTLFFEVTVTGDNHEDPGSDIIAVSVTPPAGEPFLSIEFDPMSTCAVADCSEPGLDIASDVWFSMYLPEKSITSDTWTERSQISPTEDVVVVHPWVETTSFGATFDWTVRFGLQLEVDTITDELSSDQRVFVSALHSEMGWTSSTLHEEVLLCESGSPTSNDCLTANGGIGEPDLPYGLPIFDIESMWPRIVTGGIGSCPAVPVAEAVCP